MKKIISIALIAASCGMMASCGGNHNKDASKNDSTKTDSVMTLKQKIDEFATVKLTTDLSKLSEKEKQMISIFVEISEIMDNLFWEQTLGSKSAFLDTIKDPDVKRFAEINYGPWERMGDDKPFMSAFGVKPAGANFYPSDITKEEFEKLADPNKSSQYTIIRRNADKSLKVLWYHEAWADQIKKVSDLLLKAAELCEEPGLKKYLTLRAKAVLTDDYLESDMAWMDMKNNNLDFVVGPIEDYEDKFMGKKTSFEAAILVKDKEWSAKLAKFSKMLPELQKGLPAEDKYKKEVPGSNSDLGAYEILYYAGHANSGGKTIAINLPNDERVHLKKGSRRLQLKNAMRAKFDNILLPISKQLIDPSQQANIKFDAFFGNVMFHEVAHGLGIKNTVNNKGTVRDALQEQYSAWEEAKADILGLYMTTQLIKKGELKDVTAEDCIVTFMAGLIRSVRFGAADAHGQANMMCFNFFEDAGAFTRSKDGMYKVDFAKTYEAMNKWSAMILKFQGEGDYAGAKAYLEKNSNVRANLQKDIAKLRTAKIPVDVVFEQGKQVLGLQ